MLAIHAIVLSIVASVSAYMVTFPNQSQGWTNVGNQTVQWQRVNTDPLNFTIVLVNDNTGYSQMLAALVDGTLGQTSVNPPSGGWPVGPAFRVNLVKDPNDLSTIYAQSSQFLINATSQTTTGIPTMQPATGTTIFPPTTTDTGTLNPTSTGVYQGSSPNGSLRAMVVPTTVLGAVTLVLSFCLA